VQLRIDHYHHIDSATAPDPRLDQVLALLLAIRTEIQTMSGTMDAAIADLTAKVNAQTEVDSAALTLIQGIPAMIQTAVDAAIAAGATQSQVAAITELGTRLAGASQPLADAVVANTPAAP